MPCRIESEIIVEMLPKESDNVFSSPLGFGFFLAMHPGGSDAAASCCCWSLALIGALTASICACGSRVTNG